MIRQRAISRAALAVALLFSVVELSQAQVRFDVDDRGAADPANTQPGFDQFLIDAVDEAQTTTTQTFGSVEVTISHSNPSVNVFEDRRRAEPTNEGAFTQQELFRDFIFARGVTPDDGLDIAIANLMPNAVYDVRIWAFDDLSPGDRVSDWSANGILVQDDYAFNGDQVPPAPAMDDPYTIDFMMPADSSGTLLVQGRWQGGGCCGVFLNGMSVELNEDIVVGDFTGDGQINEDDFNTMAANMFGHLDGVTGHENGDLNFDGLIDLSDFHKFVEDFPAAAAAAQGVPEPSSLVLAIVALLGVLSIRRRTHRG